MKKCILFCLFMMIIGENMLAQVYRMINKYENIPQCILSEVEKMGVDENSTLTELEGKYFNAISQISRTEFDLSGKKVAFFIGNIGSVKSNKKKYFIGERERLKAANDSCSYYFGTLYVFDITQKEESGGYDAAIVGLSKKMNSIQDVVKRMKCLR